MGHHDNYATPRKSRTTTMMMMMTTTLLLLLPLMIRYTRARENIVWQTDW